MIHTFAEAEFPIPPELAIPGTTGWIWAELVLQIPYFMVQLKLTEGTGSRIKHILCTDISTVVRLDEMSGTGFEVAHVSALCPGSMTKSETYKMEEIIEVWENPERPEDQIFITEDGRILQFSVYADSTSIDKMQCVFRMRTRSNFFPATYG